MWRWAAISLSALAGCGVSMAPGPDLGSDDSGVDLSVQGDLATLWSTDLAGLTWDLAGDAASPATSAMLIAARPYQATVPSGYDPSHPTPLVVALHGYNNDGAFIASYFGLGALVDSRGFLLAHPDGTPNLYGARFWNATDACCNLFFQPVDDVAYVNAIVDDMSSKYNVDPKRIFLVGHSNGAFMSHRFACEKSPRVAAIASFGGAQWFDASRCQPTVPVSVVEIHGDMDPTIHYDGGFTAALYPSAHQTVATWAAKDACTSALTATGETRDLISTLPGSETIVERYTGCAGGTGVELWTVQGGVHVPSLNQPSFGTAMLDFLMAHPKP
jgi:polyhydroxybutyrate depolymerase